MRYRIRHLFRMGMGGILVWTALVAVPPQALADTLPGNGIRALQQTRASTQTAPVKADMGRACQTQCQAIAATLDALSAQVQAAQVTNDPTQMRAALHEVQQQQAALKEHMAMCTQMTGMMPSMPGGMGGAQHGR